MKQINRDYELPRWCWLYLPPVMLLVLLSLHFTDPILLEMMLAKDHEGGIVEILTVVLLLPGILLGAHAWLRYRPALPNAAIKTWLLLWVLALIYFAGEEISWGQWLFYWETPESIASLNDQGETNLHNMSSWLDQKPRLLIELGILVGGLILPVLSRLKGKALIPASSWLAWIFPTVIVFPSAACFLIVRVIEWVEWHRFIALGSSELREYYIALFLALYVSSIAIRAHHAHSSLQKIP